MGPDPQLVPTAVRVAIALVFLSVGAADVAFGATVGKIVGVVLVVPLIIWIGALMRRRRAQN